jgi:hypothetical protein
MLKTTLTLICIITCPTISHYGMEHRNPQEKNGQNPARQGNLNARVVDLNTLEDKLLRKLTLSIDCIIKCGNTNTDHILQRGDENRVEIHDKHEMLLSAIADTFQAIENIDKTCEVLNKQNEQIIEKFKQQTKEIQETKNEQTRAIEEIHNILRAQNPGQQNLLSTVEKQTQLINGLLEKGNVKSNLVGDQVLRNSLKYKKNIPLKPITKLPVSKQIQKKPTYQKKITDIFGAHKPKKAL